MPRRLVQILLALFLVGLAGVLIEPVAATMLTPGWLDSADIRDWASMLLFLCVAGGLLIGAIGLAFRRARSPYRVLGSTEWWAIAGLSITATVCAGIASHWTIALPGLVPTAIAATLARRRAREERISIVAPDAENLPPRATFTGAGPSGKR
ncbi:MAG TPA: hypothetical protein VJ650_12660 [Gemmatimonadaceae bacterium]|nr:hypothetical protein [Gemmatimonadaceae bacterium]